MHTHTHTYSHTHSLGPADRRGRWEKGSSTIQHCCRRLLRSYRRIPQSLRCQTFPVQLPSLYKVDIRKQSHHRKWVAVYVRDDRDDTLRTRSSPLYGKPCFIFFFLFVFVGVSDTFHAIDVHVDFTVRLTRRTLSSNLKYLHLPPDSEPRSVLALPPFWTQSLRNETCYSVHEVS